MYQSTRSSYVLSDVAAVLKGIAPDGGLFADASLPSRPFDAEGCMGLRYTEMAEKIMCHHLPGFAPKMKEIVSVYPKKFSSEKITPLVPAGDAYSLELYHGPTSAFKDVALSVLPLFITAARDAGGSDALVSILTATSGDTGKAALEGFHDVPGTEITVFFPDGGVSEMQRLQMVTQEGKNVHVFAVRGNFDDCQRGVKEAFALNSAGSLPGTQEKMLTSANSINIGRLVPQVVYYFSAYSQLIEQGALVFGEKADFVVPTGNFGDILAGYMAKLMGLPVGRLICASNANNVLYDFITTGVYDRRREFYKTASPSMDILVSSNLERLLFYASGGDTAAVSGYMKDLSENGFYNAGADLMERIRESFSAEFASEEECAEAIREAYFSRGMLIDTHTGVGFAATKKYMAKNPSSAPCVVLSTASPFKFPTAVLSALGEVPGDDDFENARRLAELSGVSVPENLAGLKEKHILHSSVISKEEIITCSACPGGQS